jgi:hypothetical protein
MANTAFTFTGEDASRAMLEGLTSRIREALRTRILERLEPDIEQAIEAGVASFKATVEGYKDFAHMRETVRVLIERK